MSSERCKAALDALKSESMPLVIDAVIRADNALLMLDALKDPFTDALCVVMYAGRDEFNDGHPYDKLDIDTQFAEWWDYLTMEGESFAREQMASKAPLASYLRWGAYMFHIEIAAGAADKE